MLLAGAGRWEHDRARGASFHHGRTEAIRAFTADQRDFVLAMVDPNVKVRAPPGVPGRP